MALAASVTGAELAVLQTGVSQTRWGQADLALELPLLKEAISIADASAEVAFATHTVVTQYGARALLGLPLHTNTPGTLWLLSKRPNAFEHVGSLDRVVGVVAALVSPAQTGLAEWVTTLPSAAVCVMGEMVSTNAAASRLIGFSQREVSTIDTWFAKLHPSNSVEMRAEYENHRAQGFLDPSTVSIQRKDGSMRLIEFTCTSAGGGELWLLADVTERVASQERFRLLFEHSSTARLIFDEGGVVDCNPAAVALLGHHSKADLLRVRPRDLSPELQPDGQPSASKGVEMEAIAFASGCHRFDWEHRRADGSTVSVEVTLTPLTLGSRPVLLAEWHDITERRRSEEVLEQARDSALKFARAKADFLATMSHEIRTPMNGVIGMTRLLLDTPLSATQRDYVETVRACGEGLLAVINDILDFSRLDAGKVSLERIDFSLGDLLEDALSVVAGAAHEKGLELVASQGKNAPDRVFGDPTRLRQVLLNLLSNAVKFTGAGEITLGLDSSGTDDRGRRVVTLKVADTGPGIAADALPHLFTAFTQEDASTARRFGGSGLGLAICQRLVSLMGGAVEVSSSPKGTQFTVTLAFDEAGADEAPPSLAGRSVLVVAPHPASSRMLTHLVQRTGASVRTAGDLDTARAWLDDADLLLVDHAFQDFGAQQLQRGLRVALITSMVGVTTSAQFAFALPKPFRRRQLFAMLERALVPSGIVKAEVVSAPVLRFKGLSVLVAEDNVVNQRVIRGLLARLGCTVHIVDNGQHALEKLAHTRVDLVLMDCQMPEVDGLEATRRLRARETVHRTPVVALTAGVMERDRERCLAAGMDDFLAKPVRPDELERAIATWARSTRQAA